MADLDEVHALLVRSCAMVGFTPPQPDQTPVDWADEVLSWPLAPRGGAPWAEGHEHVLDALQAALDGNELLTRACLKRALCVVHAHGPQICACAEPVPSLMPDRFTGRPICSKCLARRRES